MDQPVPIQYLIWLGHVLTGDLGYSTSNSEPVFQALLERLPATLELMGASRSSRSLVGVFAGIISAVYHYSFTDYLITTLAFFGQSMPVFWFALMMQLAFSVHGIPLPFGYQIQLPSAGISTHRHLRSRRPAGASDLAGDRAFAAADSHSSAASCVRRCSKCSTPTTCARRRRRARVPHDPLQARLEERAHPGGDGDRALAPRTARRRDRHRDDLRVARHGAAVLSTRSARAISLCSWATC